MINKQLIIIGGGPAGLSAAIAARRAGGEVTLLEGNTECGQKLLLSGSGQCNFTNNLSKDAFLERCSEYGNYLKPAFYALDNTAFVMLLEGAGCQYLTRSDGKVFPASMRAADVRNSLLRHVQQNGVEIVYSTRVASVRVKETGGFILQPEAGQTLASYKVIIATGGASYPQTGSDGYGLQLANSLGHSIIPFRTALGNLDLEGYKELADCAGTSLSDIRVKFLNGKACHQATGDLLFTHSGVSGPVILDNCHRVGRGTEISLCLQPAALIMMKKQKQNNGKVTVLRALQASGIPRRLLTAILSVLQISSDLSMADLDKARMNRIADTLQDLRFRVARVQDISTAMASAGGVPLSEINAKTMQSRICPGLYFAGEILDYALPTGGFNIQMAASTGWLAGVSAVRKG